MMTEHSVAKLLDGGEEGRDWRALGNLLGYKEVPFHHHHLEEFVESDVMVMMSLNTVVMEN